jgi:hypothetical protein
MPTDAASSFTASIKPIRFVMEHAGLGFIDAVNMIYLLN